MFRILCLFLLVATTACGRGEPNNQNSPRILANPYNSKVRGNVYHSDWKDLEIEFPTRTWRVENGEYALHLVAKDKFSQVIFGSRLRLLGSGSLEARATKVLRKLGMRDFEILSKEPTTHQGLDALVLTVRGEFLVDYFKNLRVQRKVRLVVTKKPRRVFWMAYISTEDAFADYLPAVEELQKSMTILSQPRAQGVAAGKRGEHAWLDVADGEGARADLG